MKQVSRLEKHQRLRAVGHDQRGIRIAVVQNGAALPVDQGIEVDPTGTFAQVRSFRKGKTDLGRGNCSSDLNAQFYPIEPANVI
jgi:hypothetical protein